MKSIIEQYRISGGSAREISACIESAVVAGDLRPGVDLPSVRRLAAGLSVSPATVASAYKDLRTRGIVRGHSRSRTSVSLRPPLGLQAEASIPGGVRDLATGNPDPQLLPDTGAAVPQPRLYRERLILPELEAAIPERLETVGLTNCAFTVVSGAMDGIERVLQAHLRAGDRVAVEDPGYSGVLNLLPAMGLELCPVYMDDEGIRPDSLEEALRSGVSALIVTPRAQNPTGAMISETRAAELRALLGSAPDTLVVEDDHLGQSADVPYNTLTDQERPRWAFIHSVSKSLGPDLRTAILAGDPITISRVEGRLSLGYGWISAILQRTVAKLWGDPSAMEQVVRAAHIYSMRRRALLDALLRNGIEGAGVSGLNVWIPVSRESPVVSGLSNKGWAVRAGESYRISTPSAVRVTTATLKPEEADEFADDFLDVIRASDRTRPA